MLSLIRKRGNMLPPSADIMRITIVEMPAELLRAMRHSGGEHQAEAGGGAAVTSVMTTKPGRWREQVEAGTPARPRRTSP